MADSLNSTIELNNGVRRPVLGLGVYQAATGRETEDAVRAALAAGSSEETPQLIRRALQRLAARGGS